MTKHTVKVPNPTTYTTKEVELPIYYEDSDYYDGGMHVEVQTRVNEFNTVKVRRTSWPHSEDKEYEISVNKSPLEARYTEDLGTYKSNQKAFEARLHEALASIHQPE